MAAPAGLKARLANWLVRQWLHRGWWARMMWPWHRLMLAAVTWRQRQFLRGERQVTALPVPVVVVGNRVVGGAGKTPTVLAVVAHLKRQGRQPGVLSRGYGRDKTSADDEPIILDAQSEHRLQARQVGDECWLIWRHTAAPMAVANQRSRAGQALLDAHPEIDILVCDDGLQHRALARQIEIVVFDERGQGNGWLLPAGLLREPIDAPPGPGCLQPPLVLYNAPAVTTPLPGYLVRKGLAPLQPWQDWWQGAPAAPDAPAVPQSLRDSTAAQVWAVAGIAQPRRFFAALQMQGLRFTPCPLPDHDRLDTLPWPPGTPHVILTEKDAVKLCPERLRRDCPATEVWVAALDFHPEPAFWQDLDQRLNSLPPTITPQAA